VIAIGCPFHVLRSDLRNFEGSEADVAAQLDDEIVAMVRRHSSEFVKFGVGHPDLVFVRFAVASSRIEASLTTLH